MVAYSFQARFAEPILAGTKDGTIRRARVNGHATVGKPLQLYTGLRTKQCRLILRTSCSEVQPIRLRFRPVIEFEVDGERIDDLHAFARRDGFDDLRDMERFWSETHGPDVFDGFVIRWPAHRETADG